MRAAAFHMIVLAVLWLPTSVVAKDKPQSVGLLAGAFAPNAGGQEALSLRWAREKHEISAFSNSYLLAGGRPLVGGMWSRRLPVCDHSCWWQFWSQMGAGLSTAGPLLEISWGMQIPLLPLWLPRPAFAGVPALRIDFATHMFITRKRFVVWSYPLWAGIAVPF